MLTKNKELLKNVLNLTHPEQWPDASRSDWNFGNKTQHPFSKKICGFPSLLFFFSFFFFLKGLATRNQEARTVNVLVVNVCEGGRKKAKKKHMSGV